MYSKHWCDTWDKETWRSKISFFFAQVWPKRTWHLYSTILLGPLSSFLGGQGIFTTGDPDRVPSFLAPLRQNATMHQIYELIKCDHAFSDGIAHNFVQSISSEFFNVWRGRVRKPRKWVRMEERFKQSMGKKCGDEEGETKRMKQKRKHFLLFPCHEPPFWWLYHCQDWQHFVVLWII